MSNTEIRALSKPLPVSNVNSTPLPLGNTSGQRWLNSPFALSGVVNGFQFLTRAISGSAEIVSKPPVRTRGEVDRVIGTPARPLGSLEARSLSKWEHRPRGRPFSITGRQRRRPTGHRGRKTGCWHPPFLEAVRPRVCQALSRRDATGLRAWRRRRVAGHREKWRRSLEGYPSRWELPKKEGSQGALREAWAEPYGSKRSLQSPRPGQQPARLHGSAFCKIDDASTTVCTGGPGSRKGSVELQPRIADVTQTFACVLLKALLQELTDAPWQ